MKRWMFALSACAALHAAAASEPLRPFEQDSLRQIVASHAGKPFVVVLWSLDCDYCAPSFKALANAQRKRKLDVVSIATDRFDDAQAATYIDHKLKATGVQAERWAFGAAPAEQLRYAIDPKWHGEMPRSYWYNADGTVTAHSGVITPELIQRLATAHTQK
ncbi:hypothetical protein [Massilia horti]|uniref:Thioredoxin domain-containing protein n=1 Tax=Massilia horti TaxID=2562153 RepID=A0A4Y9T8E1_9BURK|nr:hypothetical protein [Massilia horti]TFW33872.1 hypothetical protein E4O92_05415 [Massilia horti]